MFNNVNGSEKTAVGAGVGPNLVVGFNSTYVGDFVGSTEPDGVIPLPDEDSTIRIGDISNGNGPRSLQCYIGGIFNNHRPVGGAVVELLWTVLTTTLAGTLPPPRVVTHLLCLSVSAPQPRGRPQLEHQAMLNDKVEKLQATVAQQQKQIETLTAELREQGAQIQKVSAQVEMIRPTPRVVENR